MTKRTHLRPTGTSIHYPQKQPAITLYSSTVQEISFIRLPQTRYGDRSITFNSTVIITEVSNTIKAQAWQNTSDNLMMNASFSIQQNNDLELTLATAELNIFSLILYMNFIFYEAIAPFPSSIPRDYIQRVCRHCMP